MKRLTYEQRSEIIRRRAQGGLVKVIASDFGVAPGTVGVHTRHLTERVSVPRASWPLLVTRVEADGSWELTRYYEVPLGSASRNGG